VFFIIIKFFNVNIYQNFFFTPFKSFQLPNRFTICLDKKKKVETPRFLPVNIQILFIWVFFLIFFKFCKLRCVCIRFMFCTAKFRSILFKILSLNSFFNFHFLLINSFIILFLYCFIYLSISPKTISTVPIKAAKSAKKWPFVITGKTCRW